MLSTRRATWFLTTFLFTLPGLLLAFRATGTGSGTPWVGAAAGAAATALLVSAVLGSERT